MLKSGFRRSFFGSRSLPGRWGQLGEYFLLFGHLSTGLCWCQTLLNKPWRWKFPPSPARGFPGSCFGEAVPVTLGLPPPEAFRGGEISLFDSERVCWSERRDLWCHQLQPEVWESQFRSCFIYPPLGFYPTRKKAHWRVFGTGIRMRLRRVISLQADQVPCVQFLFICSTLKDGALNSCCRCQLKTKSVWKMLSEFIWLFPGRHLRKNGIFSIFKALSQQFAGGEQLEISQSMHYLFFSSLIL